VDGVTEVVLAVVLGLLFGVGTFLLLRRDVVRAVWGVAIISQAANVYLVTMGGIGGGVPIVTHGGGTDPATVTDPLVQALVLTAIVIGFGTTAFALVLTYRVYEEHGTIDLHELGDDELEPPVLSAGVRDDSADVAADGGTATADADADPTGGAREGGDGQ
jgi:multicomponent Na+:H+ antiporter subunit C